MAKKIYEEINIAAIAERIRANTGGTATYNTEEMAGGVDEVYTAGIAEGKQAAHDAFWDAYQVNGKRTNYSQGFSGLGWTNETFKPKYDIKPSDGYMMFKDCRISGDLVELLENCGVSLDFSAAVSPIYCFQSANLITRLGVINLSKVTEYAQGTNMFNGCSALTTIDLIVLPEVGLSMASTFSGCKALTTLTIEGTIKHNTNVQSCPLTRASIESIISHLSDTTSGLTVTFKKTAKEAAFTADEWAALIATKSNWTISLV